MHRRHSHRIVAIVSRAILLGSTLVVGFCAITATAVWGFGPPSNVVADVSPDLPRYELRRIGIIAFANQSGTPDAGVRVGTHQRVPPCHHRAAGWRIAARPSPRMVRGWPRGLG